MIQETIYHADDLHSGECEWCGEQSDELILFDDQHVCVDCIEEEEFIQATMKTNINNPYGY